MMNWVLLFVYGGKLMFMIELMLVLVVDVSIFLLRYFWVFSVLVNSMWLIMFCSGGCDEFDLNVLCKLGYNLDCLLLVYL